MDREILFRAKQVCNNEWVEGYYLNCYYPGNSTDQTGHFIVEYPGKYQEIYLDTLCQYTGLTDKNGRKIFEGDIINDIDYGIMKCIYLHGSFVWYKEDRFRIVRIECMKYVPVIEIIGNIFDNPELIGELNGDRTMSEIDDMVCKLAGAEVTSELEYMLWEIYKECNSEEELESKYDEIRSLSACCLERRAADIGLNPDIVSY